MYLSKILGFFTEDPNFKLSKKYLGAENATKKPTLGGFFYDAIDFWVFLLRRTLYRTGTLLRARLAPLSPEIAA